MTCLSVHAQAYIAAWSLQSANFVPDGHDFAFALGSDGDDAEGLADAEVASGFGCAEHNRPLAIANEGCFPNEAKLSCAAG